LQQTSQLPNTHTLNACGWWIQNTLPYPEQNRNWILSWTARMKSKRSNSLCLMCTSIFQSNTC